MKLEYLSIKDAKKRGHSDKNCCCGGHNMKNAKKNLKHHATKIKLDRRKSAKTKEAAIAAADGEVNDGNDAER